MRLARSRTLTAAQEDVWRVVGDPHYLPRWWPLTERVEAVDPDAWTSVMRSSRGKVVRADYHVEVDEPPRLRAWSQLLEGSPFERVLREHRTEVVLAEADRGTRVTITVTQRGRGTARLGTFLLRRATRRRVDEALSALEETLK